MDADPGEFEFHTWVNSFDLDLYPVLLHAIWISEPHCTPFYLDFQLSTSTADFRTDPKQYCIE